MAVAFDAVKVLPVLRAGCAWPAAAGGANEGESSRAEDASARRLMQLMGTGTSKRRKPLFDGRTEVPTTVGDVPVK